MALTALQVIAARAPQYVGSVRVTALMPLAQECYGVHWGTCQAKAQALIVLHWITIEEINGGDDTSSGNGFTNTLSGIKEGDLSLSRKTDSSDIPGARVSDEPLKSTQWGLELTALKRACFMLPTTSLM